MSPQPARPSPQAMRKANAYLTIAWIAAGVVVSAFAFVFPDNPYLLATVVFVSFYANAAGHLGAWAASRVEEKQDAAEQRAEDAA